MTDPIEIEEVSPVDAFSLLGHKMRLEIIQAFWETGNNSMTFSELRDYVAVPDSGQFNYHLGELVGTFVRREADGYEITYAGQQIVGAILDGTYTKHASIESLEIGVPCVACKSQLEASYENEFFTVGCPDCNNMIAEFPFPPGALDGRTGDEFAAMAAHWLRANAVHTRNGICPNCAGVLSQSFNKNVEHHDQEVELKYDCQRCMWDGHSTVGVYLLSHPAVISFYYDHDINLADEWWKAVMQNKSTTVLSEDPWRISVKFSLSGDERELVIDGDLGVVEQERR